MTEEGLVIRSILPLLNALQLSEDPYLCSQLLLNIVWVKFQYKPKTNLILVSHHFYITTASQIQSPQ